MTIQQRYNTLWQRYGALLLFGLLEALLLCTMYDSYVWQRDSLYHGDVYIHMNAAQRILHGEAIYRDIIGVNFPIHYYMRIPTVFVAEWLGMSNILIAKIFDNIVAFCSMSLVLYMLSRAPFAKAALHRFLLAVVLVYVMFTMPSRNEMMGQKEFFYFLLTAPYFTMASLYSINITFPRLFRIIIGMLAAVGFCYKPTCILPLLLVEAYLCWRASSFISLFRAEFVACVVVGITYLFWMLFYLDYLHLMLPYTRFYYEARDDLYPMILLYSKQVLPCVVPVALLWCYNHYTETPLKPLLAIMLLACVGYTLNGVVQMKTYIHHLYPLYAYSTFIFGVCMSILWWMSNEHKKTGAAIIPKRLISASHTACLLGLVGLVGMTLSQSLIPYPYEENSPLITRVKTLYEKQTGKQNPTYYQIGFFVDPMFPYGIEAGLTWDYHFYHLWPLQGTSNFRRRHQDDNREWAEEQVRDTETMVYNALVEDVERLHPNIIAIENDLWLKRFLAQRNILKTTMQDYRLLETVEDRDIYIHKSLLHETNKIATRHIINHR